MTHTVLGVFDDQNDAQQAENELIAQGFVRDSVRITSHNADSALDSDEGESLGEKIGNFFANLFGAPDQREYAGYYAEAVRRGSVVVSVDTDSEAEAERARAVLERYNAIDIDERSSQWRSQGWSGYDPDATAYTAEEIERERTARHGNEARIPVVEEKLKVGKREVERGGVRVFSRIAETPVEETVSLREERARVERRPVDRPATAADLAAFQEGTIEVRETAEEAVVEKTARVVEEVSVGKEASERTETVRDTVRHTEVDVEQVADLDSESKRGQRTSVRGNTNAKGKRR